MHHSPHQFCTQHAPLLYTDGETQCGSGMPVRNSVEYVFTHSRRNADGCRLPMTTSAIESILWDDWHVVAELARLTRFRRFVTTLLGVCVTLELDPTGNVSARRDDGTIAAAEIKYGFVWICLGSSTRGIVEFAECLEPDRLLATAGSVGVAVSGLRAVENFLDLSH